MKSGRESALINKSLAKPSGVEMPQEAMLILKKLQLAKAYGSKRKYEKELVKLAQQYPHMSEEIFKLKVWN